MDKIIQESPHYFQEMVRQNWILTGRSALPGMLCFVLILNFGNIYKSIYIVFIIILCITVTVVSVLLYRL